MYIVAPHTMEGQGKWTLFSGGNGSEPQFSPFPIPNDSIAEKEPHSTFLPEKPALLGPTTPDFIQRWFPEQPSGRDEKNKRKKTLWGLGEILKALHIEHQQADNIQSVSVDAPVQCKSTLMHFRKVFQQHSI